MVEAQSAVCYKNVQDVFSCQWFLMLNVSATIEIFLSLINALEDIVVGFVLSLRLRQQLNKIRLVIQFMRLTEVIGLADKKSLMK